MAHGTAADAKLVGFSGNACIDKKWTRSAIEVALDSKFINVNVSNNLDV